MKGSDIRFLSGVSDLARLDLEAAAVTLISDEKGLTALYSGMYSNGWRRLPEEKPGMFTTIPVAAARFKSIASLFDEGMEFEIAGTAKRVVMASGKTTIELNQWGRIAEPDVMTVANVDFGARVKASELLAECEIAADFVAQSMMRPIFTGIHLTIGEGGVGVTGFDGSSALFKSGVDSTSRIGSGELIVPSADFVLGLRLIGDADVVVTKPKDKQSVILASERAYFRSSLIAGEWPETANITSESVTEGMTIDAGLLKNIAAAAKALNAGTEVSLEMAEGVAHFGFEGEAGSFNLQAEVEGIGGSMVYDVNVLSKAARLGPKLTLSFPWASNRPTVIDSGKRRCYVMTRMR